MTGGCGAPEDTRAFSFHAAPRLGEWFNDPNGLVFVDGEYRLYMQHSRAAPEFKRVGWGVMTSSDLLRWTWGGVAIHPGATSSAYSGSVTRSAPLEAFLTRQHTEPGGARQTQWRATAGEGLTLQYDGFELGPAGRNVRDPFVFRWDATGDWRMLLAEPCDWSDWRGAPPSRVSVWSSHDKTHWRRAGTIGPWDDAGVMWEVPLLIDCGAVHLLVLSIVDRRDDGSASTVRMVPGTFDGATFVATGAECPLDIGPDFYAACVNTVDGWPSPERVLVGWASNWATARAMPWPGGIHGGPIALPRTLAWHNSRLAVAPIAAARPQATWQGEWHGKALQLDIFGDDASLRVVITADGQLSASREASDPRLRWTCSEPPRLTSCTVTVFVDAGLCELFFEPPGLALTAFVPSGQLTVTRDVS